MNLNRLVSWIAALAVPVASAQEPTREPVPAAAEVSEPVFHPSLLVGVRQLAHEHLRIAEIGLRIRGGDPDAESALIEEVIAGLPEDERRGVRDDPPDAEGAVEMLLCWKGFEAFQDVVADAAKRGRPLLVDDLLEVIWSTRLRELPDEREEPEIAAFLKRVEAIARQPVQFRCWWPTVGYLIFGALHTPAFWPADPAARASSRAALIQDLLEIASTSRDPEAARQVVDVALSPPLRGKCERRAVTCARGKLARLRGTVGFTRDHLEFVARFNQDMEAERRTGAPASAWGTTYKYLASFMASMKLRILLELDPASIEKPGPLGCKYGTVAESIAYYKQILEARGVQSFWIEARADLEKLLAGRLPHPSDAKIAALEEQLADPGLTDAQRTRLRAELAALVDQRKRDQRSISTFLTFEFADVAPVEQVVSELHRLDALATENQQRHELMAGWAALIQRDAEWAKRLVDAHFEQDDRYSYFGIVSAAVALSQHADEPECARALFTIATRGNLDERSAAFQNSAVMPEEIARGLYDLAVADTEALLKRNPSVEARKPFGDDRLYSTLLWAAIDVLHARRNDAWVARELAATFDRDGVNLWKGGSPFAPDCGFGNREVLEWVAATLPDAEYERLEKLGRIPADLKRVHDETKRR